MPRSSIVKIPARTVQNALQSTIIPEVIPNPIPDIRHVTNRRVDTSIRCLKHPSIPRALCACGRHQKTPYKASKGPRLELDAAASAINRASFLRLETGEQITVCMGCKRIATDHTSQQTPEYTQQFMLTIFTRKCEACGERIPGNCSVLSAKAGHPEQHKRLIIRKSKRIACCGDCHRRGPIKADDSTDYENRESLWRAEWQHALDEESDSAQPEAHHLTEEDRCY